MMHLMVDDLDAWWAHILALDLSGRFGVPQPQPPAMQPWGLRVAYLVDPAGVLWHFAQGGRRRLQDAENTVQPVEHRNPSPVVGEASGGCVLQERAAGDGGVPL